jgi:hypothetical protein
VSHRHLQGATTGAEMEYWTAERFTVVRSGQPCQCGENSAIVVGCGSEVKFGEDASDMGFYGFRGHPKERLMPSLDRPSAMSWRTLRQISSDPRWDFLA